MALSYAIGPNPKWYFVNNSGKPLAGGLFYTYRSLDKSQKKFVYTDPSNNFPWPDPITIDANGTVGPLFFEINSLDPTETYFLLVTDANGVEMWSMDHYLPSSGSGGGGTTGLDLENIVTNNIFYRHSDAISSPVPVFSTIAPSNFTGLVNNGSSAANIPNPAPDIVFLKDNTTATDTISFPLFTLGAQPITDDTAPVDYFNYTCTVAGVGETVKCLQFPISAKVQNLSNQPVIGTFWARANGGLPQQITLQWFQYFGDGAGASVSVIQQINVPYNLTNGWVKYNFQDVVPDVTGKSLGGPFNEGPNDGLFLRVQFPLSPNTCNIDLTKLTLYVGDVLSDIDFHSYDEIDSIISLPRTGDIRSSINSFYPFGWVPCNDGVLSNGDPAIVLPTLIPRARNNADTYPLYHLIWNLTSNYSTFAPIYDSAGAASTRGATAIADFEASKQLSLTRMLGRVLIGANPTLINSQSFTADPATDLITVTDATQFPTGTPVLVSNTGGALPTPLATNNVPNVYYSIYISATTIKIANSLDEAQAGTAIDLTSTGSGSNTIQSAVGTYFGEGRHTQLAAEVGPHTHPFSVPFSNQATSRGGGGADTVTNLAAFSSTTSANTGGTPFNVVQPSAFLNVFLKL